MIQVIKAADRHFEDFGWLKTHWLFAFDTYRDPDNEHFGILRVFNDDVVAPGQGFPTHPHREMEIVTVVLEGEVTHEDSMGHRAVIRAGEVQRMSAGTGVTHSEFNRGAEPLHLYQLWLFPRERGLAPSYEQRAFPAEARRNTLLPVVSGQGVADALSMNCDATIFLADLEAGRIVRHRPEALARFITIYVTSGDLEVNYERLRPGDQARITQREMLTIRPLADTRFILIDAPPRS